MTKIEQLPQGYEIRSTIQTIKGKEIKMYATFYNGQPCNISYFGGPNKPPTIGWHMKPSEAIKEIWGHYYGQITDKLNELRPEEEQALAWRNQNPMKVYHPECIRKPVNLNRNFEEITIASHSQNYEIANMICAHCGTAAVENELLDKYQLLNEGWGYTEESAEETAIEGSIIIEGMED